MKTNLTFGIKNSRDIFTKLLEEYADFRKQPLNSKHALNCALTSWHLTDWTYNEYFNSKYSDSIKTDKNGCKRKISGLTKFQNLVKKECPELEYMRLLSNGLKHCILNDLNRKEKAVIQIGEYSNEYSRHDFSTTRLVIKIDDSIHLDFEDLLLKTIEYWNRLILKQ